MGSNEPAQSPPSPPPPTPGAGAVRFGNYLLEEKLGQGGMAEVWKARVGGVQGFQKIVCVKRVLRHLAASDQHIAMFIHEAKLSAKLSHPNIVQVFELGEVEGEFYIAMEYVRGRDLFKVHADCVEAQDPLPPAAAAYIAREMAHALAYGHEFVDDEGNTIPIIHRDVSPHNVMIGDDGRVKLVDFGVAKALMRGSEHSPSGMVKGKLAYLAPEQLVSLDVSPQTDLFAAGTVFWEMLTNERLFVGETDAITVHRLNTLAVPPPSTRNPRVPPELDRIVMKALERDPAERYHTASQMALELERFCAESHFSAMSMRQILFDRRKRAALLRGESVPRVTPGGTFDAVRQEDAARTGSFDGPALPLPLETSAVSGPKRIAFETSQPSGPHKAPARDDIQARPTQALHVITNPEPPTEKNPPVRVEPADAARGPGKGSDAPTVPVTTVVAPISDGAKKPRTGIFIGLGVLLVVVAAALARVFLVAPPPAPNPSAPADAALAPPAPVVAIPVADAAVLAVLPDAGAIADAAPGDAAPLDAGNADASDNRKKRSRRSQTIDPFEDEDKLSEADKRLREANQHFNTGDFAAAKEDSVAALLAGAPARKVWRLLGPVSCHLHDEKRAKESLRYLSSDDKERTINLCREQGIELAE